jgi:signal transduction histidine kinase
MNTILEQQVKERTAELEARKIDLEKKNGQLHELNASKDKFFSIISHDLRSPFTALLGYTEVMLENVETYTQDELKEDVSDLHNTTKKLYALLENLLTWSRIQRGIMKYVPKPIDLYEITQNNVRLFTPKAKQKQIALNTLIRQHLMAYADYRMVDTVIRNLTSNALKFTSAGGSITFSATQNEQSIEVSVADTGVGIAEEALPQLFRIDTHYLKPGTDGEEGTGLGLILCRELVEKNTGKIWVESKLGEGTIIRFTLPLFTS